MRHFVYRISHTSGYFYIGKHSLIGDFGTDYYWGSGVAINACYRAQGFTGIHLRAGITPTGWSRASLSEHETIDGALKEEKHQIALQKSNPFCLNKRSKNDPVVSLFENPAQTKLKQHRLAKDILLQQLAKLDEYIDECVLALPKVV
jgi:hypothetical protein